ncbi:hypothetical protein M0R19_06195 [Candidatus Pacearchaeota archaeon]|jgi:flagellar biosynthesis component FlhA|nr:hypothetical protein [Candidatus Pacearchaeota archaeon]
METNVNLLMSKEIKRLIKYENLQLNKSGYKKHKNGTTKKIVEKFLKNNNILEQYQNCLEEQVNIVNLLHNYIELLIEHFKFYFDNVKNNDECIEDWRKVPEMKNDEIKSRIIERFSAYFVYQEAS